MAKNKGKVNSGKSGSKGTGSRSGVARTPYQGTGPIVGVPF